jgi:Domain of unknown function (DUF4326)
VTTRVVHKREPHDVFIGRPSPWGNPFSHLARSAAQFRVPTREAAIAEYERWLRAQPELVLRVRAELRGRVLGCYCKPLACHGDVLARVADEEDPFS